MIYTSYFAKLRNIPKDVVPIAICKYPPKWYRGLTYKALAPPEYLLHAWKGGAVTEKDYIRVYKTYVLDNLNPQAVIDELIQMPGGRDVVLLCYEKIGDFCHRHLVAEWLRQAGYKCEELDI